MSGQTISPPALIAIAGGSGSGKSWLAGQLHQRLGKELGVLSLDEFYLDRSYLSLGRRARVNFDHPRAIDWRAFDEILAAIKAGGTPSIPCYDFATHACRAEGKEWKARRLVLVEGLWTLRTARIRKHFSYSIFVECPEQLRLERRLARDVAQRGRTEESIRQQFALNVAPMHDRHVASQARWADLVLNSPASEADVDRVTERLKQFLAGDDYE